MKILRLRFTNLNSLAGESIVDFTAPPLSQTGLFAITGPTGAGKTTLLDAITLALYGRAARYGSVPNPEEIMSRHTGECSAQVEFSCAAGHFRSEWNLRRARGKPTGAIQNATRKIISLPSEEILTEKLKETEAKIEELTGLNYERFLRSVMLAQGEFAAFLKADKDRAELLEQITGTQIYSEISRAAYEQMSLARNIGDQLTAQMDGVQLLTTEEREERTSRLDQANDSLVQIKSDLTILETRLANARLFLSCAAEAAAILAEENLLSERKKLARENLQFLAQHETATPFIAPLTALAQLEKQQHSDLQKLTTLQNQLPDLREALEKSRKESAAATQLLTQYEQEEQTLKPLWEEVLKLDHQIDIARHILEGHTKNLQKAEKEKLSLLTNLTEKNQTAAQQKKLLADLEVWLQTHQGDAAIAEALADLQTTYSRWLDSLLEIEKLEKEVFDLTSTISRQETIVDHLTKNESQKKIAWENQQQTAAQFRADHEKVSEAKDLPVWEMERDQAQNRLAKFDSLLKMSSEWIFCTHQQKELREKQLTLAETQKKLLEEHQRLTESISATNELVDSRHQHYELLQRVQSLSQHRHDLPADQPCPLCGSLSHPFAEENPAPDSEVIAARNALKITQSELENLQKNLVGLEKKQTAENRDLAHITENLTDLAKKLTILESQWKPVLAELKLDIHPAETQRLTDLAHEAATKTTFLQKRLLDLRELDAKLRKQASLIEVAQTEWQKAVNDLEKALQQLAHTRETLENRRQLIHAAQQNATQHGLQFNTFATAFAPSAVSVKKAADTISLLKTRSFLFTRKQSEKTNAISTLQALQATIDGLQDQLANLSQSIFTLQADEKSAAGRWQTHVALRHEKFADKNVATDQDRVAQRLSRQRLAVTASQLACQKALQSTTDCETRLDETQLAISNRVRQLTSDTNLLLQTISPFGFSDLDSLRAAMLQEDRARDLRTLRHDLETVTQKLAGRKTANLTIQSRLAAEAASDALSIDDLQVQRENFLTKTSELNQTIGQLRGELKQDDTYRENQRHLATQIEIAQIEYRRWLRLSNLIGSASGASFSKFAQGLTLERLIVLANHHLARLNPRYALRRFQKPGSDDLELEIVDHYQADTVRPTASLSGGESFLASLALAVGLSELAGGRTTIESLFIDEGFGTLDADTLETAMDALDNLQASGKTIGVISHVEAMKERIPVQIRIQKQNAGRSLLEVVS